MKLPTFYQQIANTLPTDHWHSINSRSTVGQQISYRKLSFQKNLNKSVGQLSVRCWSTVGQQSADRSPRVGRQTTNSQLTCNKQSADCWRGELLFTITEFSVIKMPLKPNNVYCCQLITLHKILRYFRIRYEGAFSSSIECTYILCYSFYVYIFSI